MSSLLTGFHQKPKKQSGIDKGSNELGVTLQTNPIGFTIERLVARWTSEITNQGRNIWHKQ